MSQVPGLSDLPAEYKPEKPPGVLIRETDSKYTKLAKMGGRKNLLYFKQGVPSNEPKKYPVPEWWGFKPGQGEYPEGEDMKPRPKPSVPDYMVHQAYSVPSDDMQLNSRSRGRIPFGQDGQSHWSRDANNIRNPDNIVIAKQKRLLEPIEPRLRNISMERPAGIVVRSRAQTAKEKSSTGSEKTPADAFVPHLPLRMKTFIAKSESEDATLSKILNYGYQREWLQEREAQRRQDEERRRLYAHNLRENLSQKYHNTSANQVMQVDPSANVVNSTHQHQTTRKSSPTKSSKASAASKPAWRTTSKTAHHGPVESNASLYKMKRFESVQSRVSIPGQSSVPPSAAIAVPEVC